MNTLTQTELDTLKAIRANRDNPKMSRISAGYLLDGIDPTGGVVSIRQQYESVIGCCAPRKPVNLTTPARKVWRGNCLVSA